VREEDEIARLLSCGYQTEHPVKRLMPGLAIVAAALNADDQCLARIAAVHLQIPDLPSEVARDGLEAEDILIKSVDWNPALHPRAGTPPNPGWFAPTDGGIEVAPPVRLAQNEDRPRSTDVVPSAAERRAALPLGQRIDELGDFLERLVNAKPVDEKAIRAEIKHYYYDVGDTIGGNALNAALGDVLEPGVTPEIRQKILDGIAPYANSEPADVGRLRSLVTGAIPISGGSGGNRGRGGSSGERVVAPPPRTRPLESILAPGGERIGSVNPGATEDIRTVSPAEFERIGSDLLSEAIPAGGSETYPGVIYERPDGSLLGIRDSRRHGTTIDVIQSTSPAIPNGFRIHQK